MRFFLATIKMTLRNRQVLFWTMFFPVFMMLLFGAMFNTSDRTFEIGLVNQSNSKAAKQLVKAVKKVKAFKISEKGEEKEKKALQDGKRVAVIIIPKSLKDLPKVNPLRANVSQALGKPKVKVAAVVPLQQAPEMTDKRLIDKKSAKLNKSASPNGLGATNILNQPLRLKKPKPVKLKVLYNENKAQDAQIVSTVISQITAKFNLIANQASEVLLVKQEAYKSKNLKYIDFLLPGLLAMSLMMGGVVGIATGVTTLREKGVLKRLLLTPLKPATFFISQIITRMLIALGQTAVMILLGIVVYNLHFFGNIFTLVVVICFGATVFLVLGLVMSGIAKSVETVEPMSRALTMPMIFLSGVFFPTELMPSWLQPVSKAMPLYYMAESLRKVITEGASLTSIFNYLLILFTWGIAGLILTAKTFRWE